MNSAPPSPRLATTVLYGLLNPIPSGCFVAAFIFDLTYARSGELLWDKGAAWLIAIGLLFAVVPRLINLAQVWIAPRRAAMQPGKLDFWLNLAAIAAAIVNSFVHSRDAFGVVPAGVWLSGCTVLLLCVGNVVVLMQRRSEGSLTHV